MIETQTKFKLRIPAFNESAFFVMTHDPMFARYRKMVKTLQYIPKNGRRPVITQGWKLYRQFTVSEDIGNGFRRSLLVATYVDAKKYFRDRSSLQRLKGIRHG